MGMDHGSRSAVLLTRRDKRERLDEISEKNIPPGLIGQKLARLIMQGLRKRRKETTMKNVAADMKWLQTPRLFAPSFALGVAAQKNRRHT
jgi:hypothetical protein